MSDATQDLQNYARAMLAGFARLLLKVPVGELPDALRTLAESSDAPAAAARPRGRPAGSAAAPAPRRAAARKPGEKRSPEALTRLTDSLRAYIAEHPGQNMESITRALGEKSTDLTLPVQKLLANKVIRKEGNRRATRYYPADGGAGSASEGGSEKAASPKRRAAKKRKSARKGS